MPYAMRFESKELLDVSDGFLGMDLFHSALEWMQKGECEAAIQDYNRLLDLWKSESYRFAEVFRVYNNLAACYLQTGKMEEALYLFRLALKINPGYEEARNNIERIKNQDTNDYLLGASLERQYGENWQQIVREKFEESEDKRWSDEKVQSLSTEDIVTKLKSFGIETNEMDFRNKTQDLHSACVLSDNHWYPLSTAKDWDEDFIWFAAIELWKRWSPDQFCIEIFEDGFSSIMDEIEHNLDDELLSDDDEAHIVPYRKMLTFFKARLFHDQNGTTTFRKDLYEAWRDKSYWSVEEILSDVVCLFEEFDPEEALNAADLLFQMTGDIHFLEQKAGVLCGMNREVLGLELYKQLCAQKPDDFWIHFLAGKEFSSHNQTETGIPHLQTAYEIAARSGDLSSSRNQLRAAKELCKQYKKQGQHELHQQFKKRTTQLQQEVAQGERQEKAVIDNSIESNLSCQTALDYDRAWQSHQLQDPQPPSHKTARNDPCPCGSGQKHKKCCLAKLKIAGESL